MTRYEFGGQRRQAVVFTTGPAKLNGDVLAFDEAALAQASAECGDKIRRVLRPLMNPMTGILVCCACPTSGHAAAALPISVTNSRRFMLVSDLTGGSIPPSESDEAPTNISRKDRDLACPTDPAFDPITKPEPTYGSFDGGFRGS